MRPTQARFVFRGAARYLTEPHPFARKPLTQAPHPVQWSDLGKHAGRASKMFFPGAVLFFAWPFATEAVINKVFGGV